MKPEHSLLLGSLQVLGKMARRGTESTKGEAEKVATVGFRRAAGKLYFIDKNGEISSSPMQRRLPKLAA